MTKALLSDTLRTIERTRSRFFSIVAIVALGISFFAGMNATAPDMLETAAKYYNDTNAMDIAVTSTIGLSDEDIHVLSTINGFSTVVGEKFYDGVLKINGKNEADVDGSQLTIRALPLNMKKLHDEYLSGLNDPTFLNRPQLLKGTWPTSENQCLVDESMLSTPKDFQIGNTITIEGDGTDASASLKNTEFTITGIIRTPLYISYERGRTNIGTGKLGTFVYIPDANFLADYYTRALIKVAGLEQVDPYSTAYENYIAPFEDYLNSIAKERCELRSSGLKAKYTAVVEKNEKEYAASKADIEAALAEGEKQVNEIIDLAENGDAKLAEYKEEYNKKVTEAGNKIDKSKLEQSTQYAEWQKKRDNYNSIKTTLKKYEHAETDLKNAQSQYNTANIQVNSMLTTVSYLENLVATTRSAMNEFNSTQDASVSDIINRFEQSGLVGAEVDKIMSTINSLTAVGTAEDMAAYMEPQLQSLEERLASSKKELSDAKTELAAKKAELENAKKLVEALNEIEKRLETAETELKEAEAALTEANYDIQLGELEVLNQLSDSKNQISNYETKLQLAKEKAKTAKQEFATQKAAANLKLENAKKKLDEAKSYLLNLDTGKWLVQNRNEALCGFEEYKQTAERTAAISKIFPWIFFLVAALVCLNTMTRMVEDERTQLGTLKALGFYDSEIVFKYVFYAFVAGTIGSLAGTLLGFSLFPYAITTAYGILFSLPAVSIKYRLAYAVPAILISMSATVLSSYIAARASLKHSASSLMRPKAPKGGKRIFLERYPKLWAKLGFTAKVTARNVFRNKKRFLMAVSGVMGCTALMVAGFGLQNSINTTIKRQFTNSDSVVAYDMQVVLNGSYDTSIVTPTAVETIKSHSEIGSSMLNYMKTYDTVSNKSNSRMETYLMVPEDANAIGSYIRLKDIKTDELISALPQNGAVITEKLSKKLNVKEGDLIGVVFNEEHTVSVPVAAVAENYAFHYVFLSKEAYTNLFGGNPSYNYIMANFSMQLSPLQKDELAKQLMGEYDISAVSYSQEVQTMFQNILDALSYIVIILIVSAGLLSFIVLYNLSSININERMKEIATIKVLGFNKNEVSAYILRENILLGLIGTFFGLFLGIGLHRLVIAVGEVDIVMFGRQVGIFSFFYAALLSIVFTFFVNLVLRRNLKKVDMVESLKSIE